MADRLDETSLRDSLGSVETGTIGSTLSIGGAAMCYRFVLAAGLCLIPIHVSSAIAQQASQSAANRLFEPGEICLTYLGNAGWEITDNRKIVLVDPFLTQFARWTAAGPRVVAPDEIYAPDTVLIDKHVKRARRQALFQHYLWHTS